MDNTLLTLLVLAVGMIAIALSVQALVLYGLYKKSLDLHVKLGEFLPKAEALLRTTETSVKDTRREVLAVTAQASELLSTAKSQMARVDMAMTDAGSRAQIHMAKAELVLDNTLSKVNSTVNTVHKGILTPIREVSGVAAGLRAAFSSLVTSQRPSVTNATQDEEMFI